MSLPKDVILEKMTVVQLKAWLTERGAPTKGNQRDLVSRVNACLKYGWTKCGTSCDEPEITGNAAKQSFYPDCGWMPLVSAFSQDSSFDSQFTMSNIMSYFVTRCLKDSLPAGDFKSISKSAENLFRCGHVQAIELATVGTSLFIKSNCLPEMKKDRVYCVRMHLSKITCDIINAECGCPAGCGPCGSCKHIGALSYALADFFSIKSSPELLTCTDQLQQWNYPRGRKVEPIAVEKLGDRRRELVPSKVRAKGSQMVYDPRPLHLRGVNNQALENLRCDLLHIGKPCALLNILVPSSEKIALDHTYCLKAAFISLSRESVITFCDPEYMPNVFNTKDVTAEDILEKLSVSKEEQEDLEKKTRDQSNNALWFTERQNRITGSKCGRIIKQKEHTAALLRFAIYQKPFLHTPKAIKWGKENEELACIEYEKYMHGNGHLGLRTRKPGFVVDVEKCWLGVSPDAWVDDPSVECSDGIAEFKCPYSMADKTLEEMCKAKDFYLVLVNGSACLKRDHAYYHQVQLQLYVTRFLVKWCDFCIYTLKDVVVERIYPDKCWEKDCVAKLDNFFLNCILPELINPQYKPSYYL